MKIEKGSKLFFNWGAMHPTEEAIITSISYCGKFAFYNEYDDHGDATEHMIQIDEIRNDYENPKGSPIGIFVK